VKIFNIKKRKISPMMINDSELVYVTNEPWSKSSLNIMNLLTGKKRVIISKSSGDHTKLF
jgi:hypothetical protein